MTVSISVEEWNEPSLDLLEIDRRIHSAEHRPDFALQISWQKGTNPERSVAEILTRYQRLFPRTNQGSSSELFREILLLHRSLFDSSKPLVRADYEHALDTWQWVLRLEPNAGIEVQLGALFHDVERLQSEADQRIEHLAPDYQAFKNRHAEGGALLVRSLLGSIDAGLADQTALLVARHERREGQTQLLADADSLSFFSLNSPGFLRYFGREHTGKKIRYTLARMSSAARARLAEIRLVPAIRDQLA